MSWYVIQVRGGHEKEIAERCKNIISRDLLKECFIPEYISQKRYKGAWHDVKSVLFCGYVFMISDNIEMLNVELNKVPDFTKVVGKKKADIFPLDDEEVSFLQSFGKETRTVEMSKGYIVGDKVHIEQGPLKGKEALITKIDRHKRIAFIQISMFNKETVTKLGLEIISKY